MALPFKLVSADSHIAEPADVWTKRIERKYADRAPTIVHADGSDYFVIDGKTPIVDGTHGEGLGLLAAYRMVRGGLLPFEKSETEQVWR